MHNRNFLFILCISLILMAASFANAAKPDAMVRLPGHVLPALAKATPVEGKSSPLAERPLTLTLVLKRDDQAGFERYLRDVYDPKLPTYRKFLTQSELSDRFGPLRESYDKVLSYLQNNGFTLVEGAENRMTLTVQGTRTQTEQIFTVRIGDYKIGDKSFFANHGDPALPSDVALSIQAITGLSNLASPRPQKKAIAKAFVPLACWIEVNAITTQTDAEKLTAYNACVTKKKEEIDASSLLAAFGVNFSELDGTGQTVGLVAFDRFKASDVADYLAFTGAPANRINQLSRVAVNGGASAGSDTEEVLLDINTVMTLAPGAKVVVYDAPFAGRGASFQGLFNAMINGDVDIISNSWAYCESQTTLADVQSIEAILQTAAALGISVFSASGDTGSTCLDGSPNTAAVPASSPSITAVGGSSRTWGPGYIYETERWWDGTNDAPPTGQGGFGVSRFFTRPAYQNGLNASGMRSVPDVVANADPAIGVLICHADGGGCPTGSVWGGTSVAAPIWASIAALLNQAQGSNLGSFNSVLYPLAGTNAFFGPNKLGSDFAHVGLGSPNLNALSLLLAGKTTGPVDVIESSVTAYISYPQFSSPPPATVAADGVTEASVVVRLRDIEGNLVSGKTVTLTANPGSHVVITPPSAVTDVANGAVVFMVKNLTPEKVTFTATDSSDGIVLDQQATVTFAVPPATGASIAPPALTVNANGVDTAAIAVTLKDALNRPTPGKEVRLSQGNGHSLITGPNPSVTDSNGQIVFTATNLVNEVVTYTAVDVTDGDLPVPGSTVVTFTNGSGGACGQNVAPPVGLNGYTVTPFATGFATGALFYGNVNFGGCSGVAPPGFLDGSVYVPNFFNGDLFKLGLGGGAVSNANKLATIAPTLGWVVTGKDSKLYATRTAISQFPPNFTNGAVVELDPVTGAVKRTLVSNLPCSQGLVVDPLSGDLFFDGQCFGAGSNNANLFRVRTPSSANPTVEVYATLPDSPNGQIAFSPKGTIYVVVNYLLPNPPVYRISGTNVPGPPTVEKTGVVSNYWLNIGNVDASGEATALVTLNTENNVGRLKLTNIPSNPNNPPTVTAIMTEGVGGGVIGPDGCLYMPNSNVLYKLTDPTGGCSFLPTNAKPAISLTPTAVSPNPAQGTAQTFTATIRNINVPVDTPVFFLVTGANQQFQLVRTNANGEAVFSYTAISAGKDTVVATTTISNTNLASNKAEVTWAVGKHVTFLTLNPSPTSGTPGQPVTVVASVTDSSVEPTAPVVGVAVTFTLGSAQCVGTTNSKGIASCALVPSGTGFSTLTARFAGNIQFVASTDSVGFNVLAAVSSCVPATEICDGRDNDCDQQTDEGLGTRSCGVGACARTVNSCQNGTSQTCTPGTPGVEICGDGIDQDCTGQDLLCPTALPGDLMCDGDVDLDDLNILNRNLNRTTSQSTCRLTTCKTTCDLDGDGKITALDSRKMVNLCTRPRCAVR